MVLLGLLIHVEILFCFHKKNLDFKVMTLRDSICMFTCVHVCAFTQHACPKKKMKKRNFVIPLGLVSFGIIIYFRFFRQESKKDDSIMDYLTQDITSKIPEERRDNIPYPDSPK